MPHVPGLLIQICVKCGRTLSTCQLPADENGVIEDYGVIIRGAQG